MSPPAGTAAGSLTSTSGDSAATAAAVAIGAPTSKAAVGEFSLETYDLPPRPDAVPQEQRSLALASELITKLRAEGHVAFIAGGWVRDRFLGRPSADVDVATSASSIAMRRIFRSAPNIRPSTVRASVGGELFELTTFRGHYRQPDLRAAAMDASKTPTCEAARTRVQFRQRVDIAAGREWGRGFGVTSCAEPRDICPLARPLCPLLPPCASSIACAVTAPHSLKHNHANVPSEHCLT